SANDPAGNFPIQNLPLGVFAYGSGSRIGTAIGDSVLDLAACAEAGLIDGPAGAACREPDLNPLMALGSPHWRALRHRLSALLRHDAPERVPLAPLLGPLGGVEMQLPARIGDYTDFYASIYHATTVGAQMRPDNPLLPNYAWVPIGYHGRASSIVVSGTAVTRPRGQLKFDAEAAPVFAPTRRLDYELELGAWVGPGNLLGAPVPIAGAGARLFGVSLLNDWSARDIQRWEYQPLGPFLAKNFATSVSPWVVTLDALAPFRCPAFPRDSAHPQPLPYLNDPADQAGGGLDIILEVLLSTSMMRARGDAPHPLSRGSSRDLYWTLAQMLAHHSSGGCNLRPGDLLGTGTVSGPAPESRGCLLELTDGGKAPITLPSGETRRFLEDGDEVILRGRCAREGFRGIGLGECRGIVNSAQRME
ncbi:MAG: fumarylacetoacetase, partial [Thermoflexales bacterium]